MTMAIKEQNSEVQTLSFYTTGVEFTELIRNFILEGSFYTAYEILKDGGLTDEYIKYFFLFQIKFEGDTRNKEGLSVNKSKILNEKEFTEKMYYALLNCIYGINKNIDFNDLYKLYNNLTDDDIDTNKDKYKNLIAFSKVFSFQEIINVLGFKIIEKSGFLVNPNLNGVKPHQFSGVILQSGDIIKCDYQEHHLLYTLLYNLKYTSSRQWTEDNKVIHISSGALSGYIANCIAYPKEFDEERPTKEQIDTCFRLRKTLDGVYGRGNSSMVNNILEYINKTTNKGGKFNNLTFLDRFYNFNLPKFSLDRFEGACIRTSPKYSMAGLLNSKFSVSDYDKAIEEIKADFEKYKTVVGAYKPYNSDEIIIGNELHFFYQEYIEGKNGVCHFFLENIHQKESFTYSVSSNQGDVVNGKKSKEILSMLEKIELERIARTLAVDLNNPVQIEFVSNENGIYIVQLRLLKNNPTSIGYLPKAEDIFCKGKSFSAGYENNLKLKDILIVDSDCESEKLIGKKALIVRDDVEFSHILALSKALHIPSIYAIGDIKLPNVLSINTKGVEGLIFLKK